MTMAEFEAVMRGAAMRNGHTPEAEMPSDDEFYEDLAASLALDFRRS